MSNNSNVTYIVKERITDSERGYSHFELLRITMFGATRMPDITLARFNDKDEALAFWSWLQPLVPQ